MCFVQICPTIGGVAIFRFIMAITSIQILDKKVCQAFKLLLSEHHFGTHTDSHSILKVSFTKLCNDTMPV